MSVALDAAVVATGACVYDAERAPSVLNVSTDSRAIRPGDTFLALRGERFDGHAYVAQAIANGAAAVIVDTPEARVLGTATLLVADSLRAYMQIAGLARHAFSGRVIAITGSAGKTTTKFLLAQLLATRYGDRVLASPANENNEIGVSRLLLAASDERHDVLVVEMGARHPDDIAKLVEIAQPDTGVLTNVGDAHLGIMGSREKLADAKWALFGRGARAVLNANDRVSATRSQELGRIPHWFSAVENEERSPRYPRVTTLIGSARLRDSDAEEIRERAVDVQIPGLHNRANLAAAVAGALELGADLDAIVQAIPLLRMPEGRYQPITLLDDVRFIYDAYNANASGTIASLDAFASEPGLRRIAVLASMAELGEEAPDMHVRVGAHAVTANVDWLLVGGDHAEQLIQGARGAGLSSERIVPFATNSEAARWLREHALTGDVVLLKGSRKYSMEEIVEELQR